MESSLMRFLKRYQKGNSLEKDIDIFSETIGPETYIQYYLSQTMAAKRKQNEPERNEQERDPMRSQYN